MSVAANVDFELDQGADFAVQLYWTTGENLPYSVQGPMRMEIRNSVGGVVTVLQTNENSEDEETNPDNQQILYNRDSGLIQLFIDAETTSRMESGAHFYDLFVSYTDQTVTNRVRLHRLLTGRVIVNGRITQNV